MKDFKPEMEVCPICKSKGNCHLHGYYTRGVSDFIYGIVRDLSITITRVICTSCGDTHAVLPDMIIPYKGYSVFFILRVLAEYFARIMTVEKLCARFCIAHATLYRWIKLFKQHKEIFLGILASSQVSPKSFLKHICRDQNYSDFSSSFFRIANFSFMQSHKDKRRARGGSVIDTS